MQLTYRFRLPKRLFVEFFCDYFKEREPQPYHNARDLYFYNFDLSVSYKF